MIKISKIFGDFVPRDSSLYQGLLPSIRHFENRRGEGPGDEVGVKCNKSLVIDEEERSPMRVLWPNTANQ